MNKVIITGASSMIGLALIEEMEKNPEPRVIYAVVRDGCERIGILQKFVKVKVIICDAEKYGQLPELIDGNCDVLYHFVWKGTGRREVRNKSAQIQSGNIGYTLSTLDAAPKLGCKTFVGAGSQAEYGLRDESIIGPDTPVNPIELYGIAKYAAGKLVRVQAGKYGMNCFWVRIFSVFGRYDAPSSIANIKLLIV